jgi:hypothetical protein
VPELTAADVIGAEFHHEDRIEPNHLLGLARPPALPAWPDPAGELRGDHGRVVAVVTR